MSGSVAVPGFPAFEPGQEAEFEWPPEADAAYGCNAFTVRAWPLGAQPFTSPGPVSDRAWDIDPDGRATEITDLDWDEPIRAGTWAVGVVSAWNAYEVGGVIDSPECSRWVLDLLQCPTPLKQISVDAVDDLEGVECAARAVRGGRTTVRTARVGDFREKEPPARAAEGECHQIHHPTLSDAWWVIESCARCEFMFARFPTNLVPRSNLEAPQPIRRRATRAAGALVRPARLVEQATGAPLRESSTTDVDEPRRRQRSRHFTHQP